MPKILLEKPHVFIL